jgi:general secretion pathway protein B
MSFILDALKKSESDRQQKTAPDISDVPMASRPGGAPRALLAVTGLLSITVVILLVVLLKPAVQPATAPAAAENPTVPASTEPDPVPAPSTVNSPPPRRDESPADPPQLAQAETQAVATTPPPVTAAPTVVAEPVVEPATRIEPEPAPAVETESYLTFNDLRATGKINLPDMHIDLHVYSDVPAERFVFINMNQYRENATLSEGPRLQQITSDGVLLEYVGTTFLLPRE